MECSVDGCDKPIHTKGAITFDKCSEHFIESMSSLRPDA